MELHDRAWLGFKIVILGKTPLLPMKLEQAIASAFPAMEVQLSSFESYEDAYKFCKQQRDVGLFFLTEECYQSVPFSSVFRELAAHSQNSATTAFGVILYEGEPRALSARIIGKNKAILDYLPVSDLLDSTKVTFTIRDLWQNFVEAYENSIYSKDLQSSLISIAEQTLGSDGVKFILRTTHNLMGELNLSWIESVSAKWGNILIEVNERDPAVLKPHEHLKTLLTLSKFSVIQTKEQMVSTLGQDIPLPKKVTTLSSWLNQSRVRGELESDIAHIASLAKPGAPKLIRHIAKNKDRIIEFAKDAKSGLLESLA